VLQRVVRVRYITVPRVFQTRTVLREAYTNNKYIVSCTQLSECLVCLLLLNTQLNNSVLIILICTWHALTAAHVDFTCIRHSGVKCNGGKEKEYNRSLRSVASRGLTRRLNTSVNTSSRTLSENFNYNQNVSFGRSADNVKNNDWIEYCL